MQSLLYVTERGIAEGSVGYIPRREESSVLRRLEVHGLATKVGRIGRLSTTSLMSVIASGPCERLFCPDRPDQASDLTHVILYALS